jgi:hypothetical protein
VKKLSEIKYMAQGEGGRKHWSCIKIIETMSIVN